MAGDWLKIEKATARKIEILRMSEILNIHPDQVLGICFRFWCWVDDNLTECHARNVTHVTLESVICHTGFVDALIKVGWLQVREGSLVIPNFYRHLSQGAKNRGLATERKQKQRHARNVTKTGPEKRREENIDKEDTNVSSKKKFIKPTVEEVKEAVKSKGYHFDPESFHAFYESKGWLVGRNPMKDWHSAMVTWQKTQNTKQNYGTHNTTRPTKIIEGIIPKLIE